MQLELCSSTFSQLPSHNIAGQTWSGVRQSLAKSRASCCQVAEIDPCQRVSRGRHDHSSMMKEWGDLPVGASTLPGLTASTAEEAFEATSSAAAAKTIPTS